MNFGCEVTKICIQAQQRALTALFMILVKSMDFDKNFVCGDSS